MQEYVQIKTPLLWLILLTATIACQCRASKIYTIVHGGPVTYETPAIMGTTGKEESHTASLPYCIILVTVSWISGGKDCGKKKKRKLLRLRNSIVSGEHWLVRCDWCLVVCRWLWLVLSLQELCCRTIAARTTIYSVDQLPLPTALKAHLKSYLLTASCTRSTSLVRSSFLHRGTSSSSMIGSCTGDRAKKHRIIRPSDSPPYNSRSSCIVS